MTLYHWYPGYSEPEHGTVPPVGAVALCGHVRAVENVLDDGRDMRQVDESSCMTCVRLRLGDAADDYSDDELRKELG